MQVNAYRETTISQLAISSWASLHDTVRTQLKVIEDHVQMDSYYLDVVWFTSTSTLRLKKGKLNPKLAFASKDCEILYTELSLLAARNRELMRVQGSLGVSLLTGARSVERKIGFAFCPPFGTLTSN